MAIDSTFQPTPDNAADGPNPADVMRSVISVNESINSNATKGLDSLGKALGGLSKGFADKIKNMGASIGDAAASVGHEIKDVTHTAIDKSSQGLEAAADAATNGKYSPIRGAKAVVEQQGRDFDRLMNKGLAPAFTEGIAERRSGFDNLKDQISADTPSPSNLGNFAKAMLPGLGVAGGLSSAIAERSSDLAKTTNMAVEKSPMADIKETSMKFTPNDKDVANDLQMG